MPLGFGTWPSPNRHDRIWQEIPTGESKVALRELKKEDSIKEFYPLELARVAEPICCTKKKEKHKW